MSKKHSSKFFRSYFASPAKAEGEAADGAPDSASDLNHRKAITEPAKMTVSAGDATQSDAGNPFEFGLARHTDSVAGPFTMEVETR
jgi:hypothetical protein